MGAKLKLITAFVSINIFSIGAQSSRVAEAIAANPSFINYDDLDPISRKIGDVPDLLYWNYEKFLIDKMFLLSPITLLRINRERQYQYLQTIFSGDKSQKASFFICKNGSSIWVDML